MRSGGRGKWALREPRGQGRVRKRAFTLLLSISIPQTPGLSLPLPSAETPMTRGTPKRYQWPPYTAGAQQYGRPESAAARGAA